MQIVTNDQVELGKWNVLLANGFFASPFQTLDFYRFLNTVEGFCANVFAIEIEDNYASLAVVTIQKEKGVKSFFSRRGIIYGGPLIRKEHDNYIEELFKYINEFYRKKLIYLETRNLFDYSCYADSFSKSKWTYEAWLNVKLNLEGVRKEELYSLFKYNRRREIKQSILNGATYHLCTKEEEIFDVYQILNKLYHKNVKLPLPSFNFFLEFFRSKIMKVFIVMHREKIIGGSFCPVLPGKGLYIFYYCGQREYHKRIFPTHLAVLAALDFAVETNIPLVDFMGAGKPGVDYGVRKYKLEFGGELVEQGRFLKVLNPFLYNLGKFGLKVLSIVQ
jgi:serine/alanine adding enzyme